MRKFASTVWILLLVAATGLCLPEVYEDSLGEYEYENGGEEEDEYSDIPYPVFTDNGQEFSVETGDDITFPCNARDKGPFVMLFRYISPRGTEKLLYVGRTILGRNRRWRQHESSFILNDVKKSDKGEYICRFETDPPVELHHTLNVQYPAKVLRTSPEIQHVVQGKNILLACGAEGNPAPAITWSRQNGVLPSGAQSEEGTSITLAEVDRHVEGTYICTASNGIGEPSSTNIVVQVQYKPEIITEEAILHTGEGDEAELVCIVHGRPIPDVEWLRGEQPVHSSNHVISHDGLHRHTLTIMNVQSEDFGHYTCFAQNKLGEAEDTLRVTGLPKPPKIMSSPGGAKIDAHTLTWKAETFSPVRQYRIRFKMVKNETGKPNSWSFDRLYLTSEDNGSDDPSESGTFTMMHPIDNLEPATDYEAVVSVENKFGWSSESQPFNFYTRKEDTTTSSSTSTTSPPPTISTTMATVTEPAKLGAIKEMADGRFRPSSASTFTLKNYLLLVVLLVSLMNIPLS